VARWKLGEADVERMIASGELQSLVGEVAVGEPWLVKAERTFTTARLASATDPVELLRARV
jgi:hypothetical protein